MFLSYLSCYNSVLISVDDVKSAHVLWVLKDFLSRGPAESLKADQNISVGPQAAQETTNHPIILLNVSLCFFSVSLDVFHSGFLFSPPPVLMWTFPPLCIPYFLQLNSSPLYRCHLQQISAASEETPLHFMNAGIIVRIMRKAIMYSQHWKSPVMLAFLWAKS